MPEEGKAVEPRHVILVDPSERREALAERLRMQGYVVHVTADPGQGAYMALSEPPAALIADLWMPGISGVQMCRLLCSEPATKQVPIILRGPEQDPRNRFWAERAGAAAYVSTGRMGELVRELGRAIDRAPEADPFFTQLSGGELDIRDRIAAHLDAALFESVLASEVRALSTCATFGRLTDLLSQFVARVTRYRWLAIHCATSNRLGIHVNPQCRARGEAEVMEALELGALSPQVTAVEDEDAHCDPEGPSPLVAPIVLGEQRLGTMALAQRNPGDRKDEELVRIVARELGGPIRIANLVEDSQRLAMVDPLTGLLNRRALCAAMDGEVARSLRHGRALAVMVLDVDHFKRINDRHGHAAGDAVLVALGRTLPEQIRKGDLVGRWGGEEFVLGLVETDLSGARVVAERVRAAVERLVVAGPEGPIPVTVSVGVAAFEAHRDLDTAISRADAAMYRAKSQGRNRVEAAGGESNAREDAVPALGRQANA